MINKLGFFKNIFYALKCSLKFNLLFDFRIINEV